MSVYEFKMVDKNDEKWIIFEYLGTPKYKYFDLTKNMFLNIYLCCGTTKIFIQNKCKHKKVQKILNKSKTLQNITFFSEKVKKFDKNFTNSEIEM